MNNCMSESESEDEYEETNDYENTLKCLFCDSNLDNLRDALNHLQSMHNFNFSEFKSKYSLDDYSFRKLINFIRKKNVSPEDLIQTSSDIWDNDEYLKPANQDDAWLIVDVDDLGEFNNRENGCSKNIMNGSAVPEIQHHKLQKIIQSLEVQLEQKEVECLLSKQHIEELTKMVQKFMIDDDEIPKTKKERCVKNINSSGDSGYFNTYSHFAIHHEMLTDRIRTESYRDALLMNSHMFNNCTMLDVGCGTGILSMFAAKSGCKKVISVDQSDIIYHAMDIVRENNLNNIIDLRKGRLEDIDIGVDKVDAIISEWMGYFLLFEGMLDSVIYARDHYLKPGGKLLPNRCTISIVGSGDTNRYVELIDYWSNVYGFKMSCMKAEVVREPSIEICSAKNLITNVAEIQSFDLYNATTDCVNFSSSFNLTVKRSGSLTAIVGFFDIYFDLDNPVHFSTSPTDIPTHWKQTVFSLSEPISISEGEILNGKIIVRRHIKDIRGLIVTIQIKNLNQVYYLD